MPENLPHNPEVRVAAQTRILTPEERQLLKETLGADFEILADKPELLYCAGNTAPYPHFLEENPGLIALGQMLRTDKAVVYINRRDWEYQNRSKKQDFPTLNAAIDISLNQKNRIEELLKEYENFKTDRNIMDIPLASVPKGQGQLVTSIGHNNGLGRFGQGNLVGVFLPPKFLEDWDYRLDLEIASSVWLEPHMRSERTYHTSDLNLDPDNAIVLLEDQKTLQRAMEYESHKKYGIPFLRRIIDKHFHGDAVAFQKRWKEFYENWWPAEFQAMQDCTVRCKEWLAKQKD